MVFTLSASMMEFLVLSVLAREDAYGYQISQYIKPVSGVKDSALYPVLKRLQEEGYLVTYDQPFQGRNRRYYQITDWGRKQYEALLEEWRRWKEEMDRILEGGNGDEEA